MFGKTKKEVNVEVINMNIGSNISALRKKRGMTQEDLANELGVSAQAVSKWENNSSCPDVSLLTKIADIFGVSVDSLLRSNEDEIKEQCDTTTEDANPNNFAKNVNVKITQPNGKETNVKIPFKFVKLGLNIAGAFGLSKDIADKITGAVSGEDLEQLIELDTENGEHISISLI